MRGGENREGYREGNGEGGREDRLQILVAFDGVTLTGASAGDWGRCGILNE